MLIVDNWEKGTTTAEGVSFEVRPLNSEDTIELMKIAGEQGKGTDIENAVRLRDVMRPLIKSGNNVRNLKGVQVEKNKEVRDATLLDLLEYFPLTALLGEVLSSLLNASQLTGAEQKNSKGPSPKDGNSEDTPKIGAANSDTELVKIG